MEATPDLVRALIADQFPVWADLLVQPVATGGWCNRTFHLGVDKLVRLPSAERYAAQIPKECSLLPLLRLHLPLEIPEVLGQGAPALGYPYSWSVLAWIEGTQVPSDGTVDLDVLAEDLGRFLTLLQLAPVPGPAPGTHNFWRGGALQVYDADTRSALGRLQGRVDTERCLDLWDEALAVHWDQNPVWVHGDVSPANLIVRGGRLAAVIDFGNCAVGDPACDYSIAWTSLPPSARHRLRQTAVGDAGLWLRARGWALWKALISLAGEPGNQGEAQHRATLQAILDDPVF